MAALQDTGAETSCHSSRMQIWLHFRGDETGKFYLLHVIVSVLNKGSAREVAVNTGISYNKQQHVSSSNTKAVFFAFNLS